jgi:parallel beta-helix repeat protein
MRIPAGGGPLVESASSPGQSYYYDSGNWLDLYDFDSTANFCIKGLTGMRPIGPADGASGVSTDVVLRWLRRPRADSYDVYLGTDFSNINNATTNSAEYMGSSDVNSYDPDLLDANGTYYWRIDEVNEGDPYSPWKGQVWSFTTRKIVYIPTEYPTIQQTIDAAWDGVTIIVEQGTYYEKINFRGKNLTLISEDPNDPNVVAATVINGGNIGSVVTFSCGEDGNSILAGFTITGGNAGYGGGIYCENSSPTITNCTLSGNSALRYKNGGGGGMYNKSSSPTITNCTFSGNSSSGDYNSGGGMRNDGSNPTLVNCIFSGNSAWVSGYGSGGGMANSGSSPTVTNCTFSGNSANAGGGMRNDNYSNPTVTNCTFSDNSRRGMHNDYYSSPTLTNCTFSDNSGGGMYNHSGCSPTLTNCTFSGNSSYGMYNGGSSSASLTNCTFSSNSGYGMYNRGSSTSLTNCTFSSNSSGGMHNRDGSSTSLTNCTFSGNSGYGMLDVFGCSTSLTNCTFSGNSGNGMSSVVGSLTVTNCVLWGNGATDGQEIHLEGNSNAWVSYSDVQGGPNDVTVKPGSILNWGAGNIDADPCFVQPRYQDANGLWVEGNYYLLPYSLCIDAGDPNYISEPGETDIDGNPRIINGRIDKLIWAHTRLTIYKQ